MLKLPLKSISLRYLLPFLAIYLGLLAFSYLPPVRTGIKDIARTRTGKLLTSLLPDAIFISDPNRINHTELNSQITLAYGNRAAITQAVRQEGSVGVDVRLLSYELDPTFLMGTFFFIALVLISPVTWKRKGISLLIGGLLLYAFNAVLVYAFAIQRIASADIGIYELSAQQFNWYKGIGNVLNNANIFVIPLVVWGLLTFRREDLKRFVD
ncbi:MAG: hypothetical protein AAF847_10160 [Bacteroidota bacterium]